MSNLVGVVGDGVTVGGVREERSGERGTEDGMLLGPELSRGEAGREEVGVAVGGGVGGLCRAELKVTDLWFDSEF